MWGGVGGGGGGVLCDQKCKEMYEARLTLISRGVGEVWIFSGTTHLESIKMGHAISKVSIIFSSNLIQSSQPVTCTMSLRPPER